MSIAPLQPMRNPATGKLQSTYRQMPPAAVFPPANWLAPVLPMRAVYPIEDSNTPTISWHKCSHPGIPWGCPVRVMHGAGPRYGVLRSGAPGMILANGTFDVNGKFTYGDDGLNIIWANPVAGSYNIVVDIFDQTAWITFRWTHTCHADAFRFSSLSGAGSANGLTPSDPLSWANTYLGDTTVSPAQNKILMLRGDTYPLPIYQIRQEYNSRNIAGFPGDTMPKFNCRFNDHAHHRFLTGINWDNIDVKTNGIVHTDDNVNYLTSWKNLFSNIRQETIESPSSDNESCHTTMGLNGLGYRKCVLVSQNRYENVEVAATDMFSIESFLNERETFVITNPAYTTRGVNPVWYAKAACTYTEISHNVFNNPLVNGGSGGIISIQNSGTQGGFFARGVAEYNQINCNSGNAIRSNAAANNLPIDAINWIRRNSVIGGKLDARNYDTDPGESRFTHYDSNAIQNTDFANGGIVSESEGYDIVRHECVAASGVMDANFNLQSAYASYLYTRAATQGIAP